MLLDIEQGSAEWLKQRIGIVTGSRMAAVMAKLVRNGGEAQARKDYRAELVSEILTGRAADRYVTPAMQWGIDNEIFARNSYEIEVAEVERIGFALHPQIARFGASPDGLVGKDGLVEFKCPTTATHLDYLMAGVVPADYHWQMFAEMVCAERQWCDFVSFDPRLPKHLQLFVRRLEREEARIGQMEAEVVTFLADLDDALAKIEKCRMVDLDTTLRAM